MKRTLLLGLIVLFSMSLFAQRNAIDTYFKGHLDNPSFNKIEVTQKTFELLAEVETDDPDEQRVLEALSNIKGILVLENHDTDISAEYYFEAMDKLVLDADYQDLVVLENEEHNARFLIRENEEAIQEFVAVVGGGNHFVVASLYGDIDIANLSRMLEVMKNGGGPWLNSLNNLHSEEIHIGKETTIATNQGPLTKVNLNDLKLSIYPNPATSFINITPENGASAEMEIGFYTLLGKEIQNIGTVNLPYRVELQDLPTGSYFLRLTDKAGTYKNFKIVKSGK